MLGDVWEWTSSALRAVAGLHPDDLRALLAAVLRRGLPGAARWVVGRGVGASCGPASATGITRTGGRSSPVSGWRGRSTTTRGAAPDVPSPRLAGTRNLGLLAGARPAARSSGAVVRSTPAKARADERRRLGRRLFRRRDAAALAQRRAAVGRRFVRFRRTGAAQPLRGGGGAVGYCRHADRSQRDGAVHRRAVAVVAQRSRRPRCAAGSVRSAESSLRQRSSRRV